MNQIYLINLSAIQNYEDLSSNIKPDRIKAFVKKAQDLDLKLLLGHVYYFDFLKNCNDDGTLKEDAAEPYQRLLLGCEYQDSNGHTIIYEGLLPALVYFTLARFVETDAIRYTATGPVQKTHESGNGLSVADTVKLAEKYRSIANAYANEAERFLWDNKTDYPLWKFNARSKSARQPAARIRAIDRTAHNLSLDNTDPFIIYNQWL